MTTTDTPTFSHDVAIVGLGYVGLPTALGFREAGQSVLGIDVSPTRLARINDHDVDLIPEDRQRLRRHLCGEGFTLTDRIEDLASAVAVLICVPTPVSETHEPDLGLLEVACAQVVEHAVPGQVIILTSTSYVGTTHDLLTVPLTLRGLVPGRDVFIAFSPERIDPGNRSYQQSDVPRVVGGVTSACTEAAASVLVDTTKSIEQVATPATAEMAKLWENTFRAVNIAFANEMANICRAHGLDVLDVLTAASTKPYGFMPFYPGPGVGGHCIPCDPHYLLHQMPAGFSAPVITTAMRSIADRPAYVVERAVDLLAVRGQRVLVVGVAYKGGVADVRDSPALEIIRQLAGLGFSVDYHDPYVPSIVIGERTYTSCPIPTTECDLVIVHTSHPMDTTWLAHQRLVLDCTYRLPPAANTHLL